MRSRSLRCPTFVRDAHINGVVLSDGHGSSVSCSQGRDRLCSCDLYAPRDSCVKVVHECLAAVGTKLGLGMLDDVLHKLNCHKKRSGESGSLCRQAGAARATHRGHSNTQCEVACRRSRLAPRCDCARQSCAPRQTCGGRVAAHAAATHGRQGQQCHRARWRRRDKRRDALLHLLYSP